MRDFVSSDLDFLVKCPPEPVLLQTLQGAKNWIDYLHTPRWKGMGRLKKRRRVEVDDVHLVTSSLIVLKFFNPRLESKRVFGSFRGLMDFYIIGSNMDG